MKFTVIYHLPNYLNNHSNDYIK